jgi:hypothetical protein
MWLLSIRTCTTAAVAAAVVLILSVVHGCGPGEPEFDKAALYTPESLASELASRYRALPTSARKSTRGTKSSADAETVLAHQESGEKARKKGVTTEATKKRTIALTVDDLLDDIGNKLGLIKGVSRTDACRKMIDTFSSDRALSADDRKALTELVGRLADSG